MNEVIASENTLLTIPMVQRVLEQQPVKLKKIPNMDKIIGNNIIKDNYKYSKFSENNDFRDFVINLLKDFSPK